MFTTNHKEKLDPALLRPGRMDMHVHMSYLTMDGFKQLVSNYLGAWFSDPDRLLNRKRERFKSFEVEPGSNRDDVIINLIIILI